MLVKQPRLVVDRVDYDRPDRNDVRRSFNPLQCVEQESLFQPFSFFRDVRR